MENIISGKIVKASIEVHRILGPGLLESIYEEALIMELGLMGCDVQRQKNVPIHYKGHQLATPLRLDILVDKRVIVECKAVEKYNPVFAVQALTYLRLSGLKLALVINFNERMVKDGIHRVVNRL